MKSLETYILELIEIKKKAAELSKAESSGTSSDVSFFQKLDIECLERTLKGYWKETNQCPPPTQEMLDNWHEHDDIDPSTGEYYSQSHQLRVMGKSVRK